jgi:hypothetical protein
VGHGYNHKHGRIAEIVPKRTKRTDSRRLQMIADQKIMFVLGAKVRAMSVCLYRLPSFNKKVEKTGSDSDSSTILWSNFV